MERVLDSDVLRIYIVYIFIESFVYTHFLHNVILSFVMRNQLHMVIPFG